MSTSSNISTNARNSESDHEQTRLLSPQCSLIDGPAQTQIPLASEPQTSSTATAISTATATATSAAISLRTRTVKRTMSMTPVNWKALIPLFMIRTADAMTFTTIFPFIVEYITSLNTPKDKIGLYAGLAEGSFMSTQALTAPFWAYMADKYGRKICLISGFAVTVLCAAFVGFGSSVGWIIFWRATFGLNPVPVIVRVMLTELTDLSNRPFVFSIYSPIFNAGYVMGHLVGGLLSNPHGRVPSFSGGQARVFETWPYALPGIATALFGVLSLVIGQIWLPEAGWWILLLCLTKITASKFF
ncbi:hypothetical protein IAT40_007827 [Kwoniella sp. CBS 6097]